MAGLGAGTSIYRARTAVGAIAARPARRARSTARDFFVLRSHFLPRLAFLSVGPVALPNRIHRVFRLNNERTGGEAPVQFVYGRYSRGRRAGCTMIYISGYAA